MTDSYRSAPLSRRRLLGVTAGALTLGAAAPLLGACAETPPPPQQPMAELRWTHKSPIVLAAQGPEVVVHYISPRHDPNVEHLMPTSPETAIRTWVKDRLQCTGFGNRLIRVVVDDASVVEVPLAVKGGVSGFLTDEPDTRYDAKASVTVQLIDANGGVEVQSKQTAWRSRSINEKASITVRERAWYELIEQLMQDLDGALESGIRGYFGAVVSR